MRAGTLRNVIHIQKRQEGTDDWGQPLTGWADVCTARAHILIPNGSESIKGDAVSASVQVSIRIRYRNGITEQMRVVHGEDIYNILAVLPDVNRRIYIDLKCERDT